MEIIMKLKSSLRVLIVFASLLTLAVCTSSIAKQPIKAIYIPLADHYPGLVVLEKYASSMKKADYSLERMKSWDLLRAYFRSGEVDVAFIICPMAMDMFSEKSNFRWVSLLHRDGNALAINDLLNSDVNLSNDRKLRLPDGKVAQAFASAKKISGRPIPCGVPSLLSTHTVVLYKYLKDFEGSLGFGIESACDVIAIEVPPPKSPAFLKKNNSRGMPASFEQSLPWADVVETNGFGLVAWYSKDVMPYPHGHVECIAIATDNCINNKRKALEEVIFYLHKAGLDIENARKSEGDEINDIVNMIRKHIPEHNKEAIIQSLRLDLNVINYKNLNVDKGGLKQIMDLAVEGGILKSPIDINAFADDSFSTKITEK
jgi:NitT/TauT family transport system substrate-binding protein